jgi:hypothetical protein
MSDSLTKLNPRVETRQIGIRQLYEIKIYPLSFGDEIALLDIISTSLIQYGSLPREEQTDIILAQIITEFIKTNIAQILGLVIDQDEWNDLSESKDFMKCLDNIQLLDLIQAIYDMNFGEDVQKKAKEMAKNMVELMNSKKISVPQRPPLN